MLTILEPLSANQAQTYHAAEFTKLSKTTTHSATRFAVNGKVKIEAHLKEQGLAGAGPAEIAAHRTREAKQKLTPKEMLARHRELAARFGNQAERVMAEARGRHLGQELMSGEEAKKYAQQAVTYARDRQIEREAVFSERDFLNDALRRSVGGATLKEIRENFEARLTLTAGEFIDRGPSGAGWSYTTRQMLEIERANIAFMRDGQGCSAARWHGSTCESKSRTG